MSHALKLERWLGQAPGAHRIGQVEIRGRGGLYGLRHIDDADAMEEALREVDSVAALREIVKGDEAGAFRPLRGAPTLRRGWRMEGLAVGALVEALDVLYPTAVALWAQEKPPVTEFAETAARQTGMYRIAQVMTAGQLERTIREVCAQGCLRRRLWKPLSPAADIPAGTLPLLCPEACNYFVAQARERIVADKKEAGE